MPIFEYTCEDCGSKFEKLLRRSGDAVACPSCGQSRLKTEFSTFAAHSNGGAKSAPAPQPGMCGGGMCRTPDLCGLN
jgi:putative FmdB family regulatory protein